jgi:hypothetical protein
MSSKIEPADAPTAVDSTLIAIAVVGAVVGVACIVAAIVAVVIVSRRRGQRERDQREIDSTVASSNSIATRSSNSNSSSNYAMLPRPDGKSDYVDVRVSRSEANYGHGDIE